MEGWTSVEAGAIGGEECSQSRQLGNVFEAGVDLLRQYTGSKQISSLEEVTPLHRKWSLTSSSTAITPFTASISSFTFFISTISSIIYFKIILNLDTHLLCPFCKNPVKRGATSHNKGHFHSQRRFIQRQRMDQFSLPHRQPLASLVRGVQSNIHLMRIRQTPRTSRDVTQQRRQDTPTHQQ